VKSSALAPSKIARLAASKEWADVQQQSKVCAGVFKFDSAGHGGLVAVLPAAETVLDDQALNAFRATNRIVEVGILRLSSRSNQYLYSPEYTPESWAELKDDPRFSGQLQFAQVIVCEEDADWAMLHYVSQAVRDGDDWGPARRADYEAKGYHTPFRSRQSLLEWAPDFLDAYEGRDDYCDSYEAKLQAATIPFATQPTHGMNEYERIALKAYCEKAFADQEVREVWHAQFVRDLDARCYRDGQRARVQSYLDGGKTLARAAELCGWSESFCQHLLD
jgi:hypothetical protein